MATACSWNERVLPRLVRQAAAQVAFRESDGRTRRGPNHALRQRARRLAGLCRRRVAQHRPTGARGMQHGVGLRARQCDQISNQGVEDGVIERVRHDTLKTQQF